MKYLIRKAESGDIDRLIDLRKILLSEGEGHYVSKSHEEDLAWQKNYRAWLLKNMNEHDRILVAVANDPDQLKIVACAIGIIDVRAPMKGCLNGKSGWIQTVVVDPEERRKGIAESIMNYCFDWFKRNHVEKIVLQTTPMAKDLYIKLGFENSGEDLLFKEL
ncbi:GNAT family N-acetyltransferase [Bacillus sp. CLL-7-23]|uniref:GNAT family N-acetyltransferase n=1 Tax=Bacillus changyiensis TaxID=3004103 RepID=A0ABT4X8V7_9BACI|nr:GNAT family N-acetyltransferase [Bacillus changyiensis]MDA7028184.1 GNAT family N-acetyltransferase [Bacillus changyiensis]